MMMKNDDDELKLKLFVKLKWLKSWRLISAAVNAT